MKKNKVLGMFLQGRGIFFDSNEVEIDAYRFYDLEWIEELKMYSVVPYVKRVMVPMANFDTTVN